MSLTASALRILTSIIFICMVQQASYAADSTSLEFGTGNHTKVVRLAAQWNWERKWWASNGNHISGYWDFSIAGWRGNHYRGVPGEEQIIASIGITPVFRWQNDSLRGAYFEAGIGAHLMSDVYNNNGRRFSTAFQFGDHIGVGYVFPSRLDVGIKFQHFSNASIKKPNPGVNLLIVRASYPF